MKSVGGVIAGSLMALAGVGIFIANAQESKEDRRIREKAERAINGDESESVSAGSGETHGVSYSLSEKQKEALDNF